MRLSSESNSDNISSQDKVDPTNSSPAGISTETIMKVLHFRDERNWSQFHNPKDLAISLSLEAAELLETFQWSGTSTDAPDKTSVLHEELADVMIYGIYLADKLKINLDEIICKKIAINQAKYDLKHSYGNSTKYTEFSEEI